MRVVVDVVAQQESGIFGPLQGYDGAGRAYVRNP